MENTDGTECDAPKQPKADALRALCRSARSTKAPPPPASRSRSGRSQSPPPRRARRERPVDSGQASTPATAPPRPAPLDTRRAAGDVGTVRPPSEPARGRDPTPRALPSGGIAEFRVPEQNAAAASWVPQHPKRFTRASPRRSPRGHIGSPPAAPRKKKRSAENTGPERSRSRARSRRSAAPSPAGRGLMAAFVQGNSLQCLEPREGDPEPAAGEAAAAPPPAADATETASPPVVGAADDPSDDVDEQARRAGLLLETPEERAAAARRSRSPKASRRTVLPIRGQRGPSRPPRTRLSGRTSKLLRMPRQGPRIASGAWMASAWWMTTASLFWEYR